VKSDVKKRLRVDERPYAKNESIAFPNPIIASIASLLARPNLQPTLAGGGAAKVHEK
jgi:hypothetical protein